MGTVTAETEQAEQPGVTGKDALAGAEQVGQAVAAAFASFPSQAEVAKAQASPALQDTAGLVLAESIRDAIWTAEASTARSQQKAVGFSEIGQDCERRLALKMAGAPETNYSDPLKAMVGTGGHLILAEHFRRLNAMVGRERYLVEQPVSYRTVPGTVDLFDRRIGTVVDWKFKALAKIKALAKKPLREGIGGNSYYVQAHGYGTALAMAGETVKDVALVFVPVDGTLADIYVWREPLDVGVADGAINRVEDIRHRYVDRGQAGQAPMFPTPLCGWCPFHRPGWTGDLNTACPGNTTTER